MATTLLALSLFVIHMLGITNSAVITNQDFIKSSCEATLYPVRCMESLSGNASTIGNNEQQLAITALSVSMSAAQSLASSVKEIGSTTRMKPRDKNAVQDCIKLTDDSVESLTQSIKELGLVGKPNEKDLIHINNILTSISAASTDQSTCLEGLNELNVDAKLKADISRGVVDVSELISNALTLVDRYASKFRKTNS